jgi:hypothetical protein
MESSELNTQIPVYGILYAMCEPSIQWHLQAVVASVLQCVGFVDGFSFISLVRSITAR